MSRTFAHKEALLNIILEVRGDHMCSSDGLKEIFKLLLSLHGSVGVSDGVVIYQPDPYAYLSYVDRTSSVIKMSEGNGEQMSRSMRMAILEEQQEWETRIGEQICSQVNEALSTISVEIKLMYFDQVINGMKIKGIRNKYKIGVRQFYEKTKPIKGILCIEFSLTSRKMEEAITLFLAQFMKKLPDKGLNKLCQEQNEVKLASLEWEKQLNTQCLR